MYHFSVTHQSGSKHIAADAVSRLLRVDEEQYVYTEDELREDFGPLTPEEIERLNEQFHQDAKLIVEIVNQRREDERIKRNEMDLRMYADAEDLESMYRPTEENVDAEVRVQELEDIATEDVITNTVSVEKTCKACEAKLEAPHNALREQYVCQLLKESLQRRVSNRIKEFKVKQLSEDVRQMQQDERAKHDIAKLLEAVASRELQVKGFIKRYKRSLLDDYHGLKDNVEVRELSQDSDGESSWVDIKSLDCSSTEDDDFAECYANDGYDKEDDFEWVKDELEDDEISQFVQDAKNIQDYHRLTTEIRDWKQSVIDMRQERLHEIADEIMTGHPVGDHVEKELCELFTDEKQRQEVRDILAEDAKRIYGEYNETDHIDFAKHNILGTTERAWARSTAMRGSKESKWALGHNGYLLTEQDAVALFDESDSESDSEHEDDGAAVSEIMGQMRKCEASKRRLEARRKTKELTLKEQLKAGIKPKEVFTKKRLPEYPTYSLKQALLDKRVNLRMRMEIKEELNKRADQRKYTPIPSMSTTELLRRITLYYEKLETRPFREWESNVIKKMEYELLRRECRIERQRSMTEYANLTEDEAELKTAQWILQQSKVEELLEETSVRIIDNLESAEAVRVSRLTYEQRKELEKKHNQSRKDKDALSEQKRLLALQKHQLEASRINERRAEINKRNERYTAMKLKRIKEKEAELRRETKSLRVDKDLFIDEKLIDAEEQLEQECEFLNSRMFKHPETEEIYQVFDVFKSDEPVKKGQEAKVLAQCVRYNRDQLGIISEEDLLVWEVWGREGVAELEWLTAQMDDAYCRTFIDKIGEQLELVVPLDGKLALNSERYMYREKDGNKPGLLMRKVVRERKIGRQSLSVAIKQEVLQIVVPKSLVDKIIWIMHDQLGHPGRNRTTETTKMRYYWPGMNVDIQNAVKECHYCNKRKANNIVAKSSHGFNGTIPDL
eukprot:gene21962-28044_t